MKSQPQQFLYSVVYFAELISADIWPSVISTIMKWAHWIGFQCLYLLPKPQVLAATPRFSFSTSLIQFLLLLLSFMMISPCCSPACVWSPSCTNMFWNRQKGEAKCCMVFWLLRQSLVPFSNWAAIFQKWIRALHKVFYAAFLNYWWFGFPFRQPSSDSMLPNK